MLFHDLILKSGTAKALGTAKPWEVLLQNVDCKGAHCQTANSEALTTADLGKP